MDGIINPDYRNTGKQRLSFSQQRAQSASVATTPATSMDPMSEHWAPPDSWAVQPADELMEDYVNTPGIMTSRNEQANDYFPVVEHENWNIPSKNYCIRIFRPDGTFGTLIVPLDTTTHDLIQRLAGKFFLHDLSKYRLSLITHNHG